ncbi:MAG: efflux RND transporter permease subunit [Candidatus Omnitrophota bacterium]|jgi:Cu(I)/Ag(I) efflux system membrane protein CusA/SilA|nr:MAG: efflux RND transporter permease subunit [Candidatus Omnitrophota bacterium]
MINKIINYCLKTPFVVFVAYSAVFFWGLWAITNIPVDAIPDIGEKQVIIYTEWPGRSAKDVEDQVTYPLSVSLRGIPGVKTIRASSAFGFSEVYLIFNDNIDYYWARSRVLEKLNLASSRLPMGVMPVLGPDATGLGQIFWYTVEGKGYGIDQLRSIQDWFIRYQLNSVQGVSEVASIGGFVKQYQIDIDPNKMLAYNIHLGQIMEAVKKSNIDVGAKVVENNAMEYIIRGLGFIKSLEDIENIAVGEINGVPIYIKNIANVQLGPEFRRGALDKDGQEAVGGVVIMRYGENAMQVIHRVKEAIKELQKGLPEGVKIVPFYDRTDLIHRTIGTLREALILEIIITMAVVVPFLAHIWAGVIISITLPFSVLIAFIAMYYLKVDSNITSLSGIAIAIGTLVDMGIVMTENIYRRLIEYSDDIKKGVKSRLDVVFKASSEVGSAVITAILTTVVSFLAVFALEAQEGKLFKPLAYTKTFTLLASVTVALTLTPVLCMYLLKGRLRAPEENILVKILQRNYEKVLRWCLNHRVTFLLIPAVLLITSIPFILPKDITSLAVFLLIVVALLVFILPKKTKSVIASVLVVVISLGWFWFSPRIGREFMPPFDEGSILFMPVMHPSVSLTEAIRVIQIQDKIIKSFPEVELVVGKVGRAESATDPAPVEMFETIITLKPKKDWRKGMTKEKLIRQMDAALQIPGVSNIWTQPIVNRIDMLATGIRTSVGVKVFGPDLKKIEEIATEIEKVLRAVPGAVDLYSEKIVGKPYIEFKIKREQLARYGISIREVQDVIEMAIGGENLTTTVEGRERYPVRVRYARELRDNIDALRRVLVSTKDGAQIPISQLVDIYFVTGPAMINSENGLLRAYVLMNVRGKDMVTFVEDASKIVSEKVKLPAGYFIQWSGQFENQVRAKKKIAVLLPVSLLINFMLIYMNFRSIIKSVFIFTAVPVTLAGGIWLLAFSGFNFSVAVWVGFIALFGIAVDDGVLITTYLDDVFGERKDKIKNRQDVVEATVHAGLGRIRPAFLTTMTTIVALLPIMFLKGTGAEVMQPMAIPSIGGMVFEMVTWFIVPVLYSWREERKIAKAKPLLSKP